jgi:CheY-like chemotaxis protein
MPLVLAIEPDLRQAAIIKRIVRDRVLADVAVVDSRDAALEAMRTTVPDVLLISALLSPRDEDELIAHLRTLENADHLQTHTIPQLASALGPDEGRASRGLLSAFRRKKQPETAPSGCDPDIFAEEIRSYLQRAAEKKREHLDAQHTREPQDNAWRASTRTEKPVETVAEPAGAEASVSSWASPFEWKPSNPSALISNPYSRVVQPEPATETAMPEPMPEPITAMAEPASIVAAPEPFIEEPVIAAAQLEAVEQQPSIEEPVYLEAAPAVAVLEPALVEPVMMTAQPEVIAEPLTIEEPVHLEAAVDLVAAPVEMLLEESGFAMQASGSATEDAGFGIRDSGFGMRDQGLGIRLGSLASWMRTERAPEPTSASGSAGADDLRALLGALAIPAAVAGVGYPRGVRIRRVRVAAAREPRLPEGAGTVILSKRALAEQRELRNQPRA